MLEFVSGRAAQSVARPGANSLEYQTIGGNMGFALSDMQLTSPAFANGSAIPKQHTGEGDDVSPALRWTNAPAKTKSFAIICHDPDAPLASKGSYGFVHWVLYNIPGSVTSLEEDNKEYTAGKTDFGQIGYGGPMPPNGHG